MKTTVYINSQGKPYAVFHRSEGGSKAWEHPVNTPCDVEGCVRAPQVTPGIASASKRTLDTEPTPSTGVPE